MASEGGSPETSNDEIIGKGIDAALGDVIRGLLRKPAETVGDLVADGIGILGDRVRHKRELNARLGMEEVRAKLDADGVDMKDITPPKEEELYLLLNGMSLASDESVRDMWSGLFARALKPDAETEAERPYISILESLSPMDAKIIDLLAFIQRTKADLEASAEKFGSIDIMSVTPEAKEIQKRNAELQKRAVAAIQDKAEGYGLAKMGSPSWADNLMRQGIIEKTSVHQFHSLSPFRPNLRSEQDLAQTLGEFYESLRETQEIAERQKSPPEQIFSQHGSGKQINMQVQFTDFGKHFAEGCGVL
ncbi:MAG: Abi-alpha family protein [Parvibaculaceae bacterium]|nr:Abi-alpha family protein [Parvibaculaceae bacterium]